MSLFYSDTSLLNWQIFPRKLHLRFLDLVNDVIEVETQIARITPLVARDKDVTIADLTTLSPFVSLLSYNRSKSISNNFDSTLSFYKFLLSFFMVYS